MTNILKDRSGQMAVELAVVLPVILIAMVIIIDGVVFVSECARFDHTANIVVLGQGVTMQGNDLDEDAMTAAILSKLREEFGYSSEEIEVSAEAVGALGDLVRYDCTLKIAPWPLNPDGLAVFGTSLPSTFAHKRSFVVRPYAPGRF